METRALQTAVEWMKLCPVCRRETIHRADQDCELGLIAHCTRCGREILSTSPVILGEGQSELARGRATERPCVCWNYRTAKECFRRHPAVLLHKSVNRVRASAPSSPESNVAKRANPNGRESKKAQS